jgi:hypothetical protein
MQKMQEIKFPFRALEWFILIAASALRVVVYFQNRSLFLDEANLARNIAEKGIADFFQPLDYQQYAPPLFSSLLKISWWIFGSNEPALRLFPLIAGIAGLLLFRLVLQKVIETPSVRWVPLFFMGFSPFFLQYSTEIKQYSIDVALALFFVYQSIIRPIDSWKTSDAAFWALAGAVGIWLSMPSVFILFGVGCYYLYGVFAEKKYVDLKRLFPAIIFWLVNFGLYYFLILSKDLSEDHLISHHARFFIPLPPASIEELRQAGEILLTTIQTAAGFTAVASVAGALLLAVGLFSLFSGSKKKFILLVIPILACFLASGLQLYSLMPRLSLFLIPLILLLMTEGGSRLWKSGYAVVRPALVILLFMIAPLQNGYRHFIERLEIEEIRPVLKEVAGKWERGDLIYIHHEAAPAAIFYSRHHDRKDEFRIENAHYAEWHEDIGQIVKERPETRRLWVVFSHLISGQAKREAAEILKIADGMGALARQIEGKGAAGYFYVIETD